MQHSVSFYIFKNNIQAFKGLTGYPWYTEAFGINVLGTQKAKSKLSHVATVLAELLDNDNDGCVDDPNMMTALQAYLEDMGGFKGTIFVQEVKDVPEGVQELVCTYFFRFKHVRFRQDFRFR